jgi:hypothetical protein
MAARAALMTDRYPPLRLDLGPTEPEIPTAAAPVPQAALPLRRSSSGSLPMREGPSGLFSRDRPVGRAPQLAHCGTAQSAL